MGLVDKEGGGGGVLEGVQPLRPTVQVVQQPPSHPTLFAGVLCEQHVTSASSRNHRAECIHSKRLSPSSPLLPSPSPCPSCPSCPLCSSCPLRPSCRVYSSFWRGIALVSCPTPTPHPHPNPNPHPHPHPHPYPHPHPMPTAAVSLLPTVWHALPSGRRHGAASAGPDPTLCTFRVVTESTGANGKRGGTESNGIGRTHASRCKNHWHPCAHPPA
jgi:hypothetical protein